MSGISKRSARSVSASRSRPEPRPISTLPPGHQLAFASALPASPALLRKTPEAIASTAVDTNDLIVKLAELRSRRNEDEVQQRFEELEALRSALFLPAFLVLRRCFISYITMCGLGIRAVHFRHFVQQDGL